MKFANAIAQAYKTKWSFINSFSVQFHIPDYLKKVSGWNDRTDGETIDLHIISMSTPQFANDPIEVFVGNKWRIHNGRDQLYRFTITFRDRDQMDLYRKFVLMYKATRDQYFDDVKMIIQLRKDADWLNENNNVLFSLEDVIIEDVSQLTFSNVNENEIAEFSVGFKCVLPYIFNNAQSPTSTITKG